jgi:hypothetical protein
LSSNTRTGHGRGHRRRNRGFLSIEFGGSVGAGAGVGCGATTGKVAISYDPFGRADERA